MIIRDSYAVKCETMQVPSYLEQVLEVGRLSCTDDLVSNYFGGSSFQLDIAELKIIIT